MTNFFNVLSSGTIPCSLPFVPWVFLKHTGQLFCRTFLNLDLPDVSSWLHWGYNLTGPSQVDVSPLGPISRHTSVGWHLRHHSVKVLSGRFSSETLSLSLTGKRREFLNKPLESLSLSLFPCDVYWYLCSYPIRFLLAISLPSGTFFFDTEKLGSHYSASVLFPLVPFTFKEAISIAFINEYIAESILF